jgi:hypothetical protein
MRATERRPLLDRFWERVEKSDGCWTWRGDKDKDGYGRLGRGGQGGLKYRAHRLSYMIHSGPIPDGVVVCHQCDNPSCVRPEHLFLGSVADDHLDAKTKGRLRNGFGEFTHCIRGHKFTPENTRHRVSSRGLPRRDCITCDRRRKDATKLKKLSKSLRDPNEALTGCVAVCSRGRVGLITGKKELPWGLSWVGIGLDDGTEWASRNPRLLDAAEIAGLTARRAGAA